MADPKSEPSTPYGEAGNTKPKQPITGEPPKPSSDGAEHGGSGPAEREQDPSLQPT